MSAVFISSVVLVPNPYDPGQSLPSNFPPSFKKEPAAFAPSLLPHRTSAIFMRSGSQLQKLSAGTPEYFSPWSWLLPNTMSFMLRVNTRRGARPVNQTMWRTCGGFCAWILLFLTDVCAQSQRRYKFLLSFTELILKEGSYILTRSPVFHQHWSECFIFIV